MREYYIPQLLTVFRKNIRFQEGNFWNTNEQNASKHVERFLTFGISFHRNLTQNCRLRHLKHGILPVNFQTSMERQIEVWAQSDATV